MRCALVCTARAVCPRKSARVCEATFRSPQAEEIERGGRTTDDGGWRSGGGGREEEQADIRADLGLRCDAFRKRQGHSVGERWQGAISPASRPSLRPWCWLVLPSRAPRRAMEVATTVCATRRTADDGGETGHSAAQGSIQIRASHSGSSSSTSSNASANREERAADAPDRNMRA